MKQTPSGERLRCGFGKNRKAGEVQFTLRYSVRTLFRGKGIDDEETEDQSSATD